MTAPFKVIPLKKVFLAIALCAGLGQSYGAITDIATAPIASTGTSIVKPNLLFILDDSGSMNWTYMPDGVSSWTSRVGYKNAQCNGVYYDPNVTYQLPKRYDGTNYPNATFTGAWSNGFNTTAGTVNLQTSFQAHGSDSAQAAYYYNFNGPGTTPSSTQCQQNSSNGYPHSTANFAKVRVTLGTAAQQQNFANWYSYYRTRMLMMKSASGLAFSSMDDRYRIGFMTINTAEVTTGTEFLNIAPYNSVQKQSWYNTLYSIVPGDSTPLRTALDKAGKIYRNTVPGAVDPVEYSGQQNFTILSTDGYWNDSYSGVGDQDGNATTMPRPMFDGGADTTANNTLADVAAYYYNTDLRTSPSTGVLGTPVHENNVPPGVKDTASHQHMTTFTVGLGAPGLMAYASNYETASGGDFFNIKSGTLNNNSTPPSPCPWSAKSKPCNWPAPSDNDPSTIDDLWHAAVNGRGKYFAATNPTTLSSGLADALSSLVSETGSAAAASTSSPNVTSGDNFVFSSTYTTLEWTGQLIRQQINPVTGNVPLYKSSDAGTYDWRATDMLNAQVGPASDTRTLYFYDPSKPDNLNLFQFALMSSTQQAYFGPAVASTLSQYPALLPAQQALAGGTNLVNYLRGWKGHEGTLYRERIHALGDIVSSEAAYVKKPLFDYVDAGYSSYKSANATRKAMVYVAANDGMLHAFDAATGSELWAFFPSLVMPELYKLADKLYKNNHKFYIDGTPEVRDVFAGGSWKTILVGGLAAGGRGYYALDVTNPDSPKALWEFTDANLGYAFSKPIITKTPSGTWVVLVSSGYNNISPGDGKGYLYVLDAYTGAIISTIATGSGSTASPSGLAKITGWANNPMTDNTSLRAYGGDLNGDLWRFDLTTNTAHKLASLKNAGGGAQPITARPQLGDISGLPVVLIGTGKLLGATDLADVSKQSFYAIKDPLDGTYYPNPRLSGLFVEQFATDTTDGGGAAVRTITNNAVNLATQAGWFIDLPSTGERANTDPTLFLGTIVFSTNTPDSSACSPDGYSWLYFLDFLTGSYVNTSSGGIGARRIANELGTRPALVQLGGGAKSLTRAGTQTYAHDVPISSGSTPARRINWRELITR
ncbi:MAG: pilus assembly protein [Burkholderiales bacterium]